MIDAAVDSPRDAAVDSQWNAAVDSPRDAAASDNGESARASGREIVGTGTSEAAWQAWGFLSQVPLADFNALVRPRARLVVLAPHPDDEVLTSGGLISLAAARGVPVTVIAVTDGDASHPSSSHWPPPKLARRRSEESIEGLQRLGLGADDSIRLRIPDGHIAANEAMLAARLDQLLVATDAVVTTWHLDGHPDHEATARAARAATRRIGCSLLEAPVWMWHWASPDDARVPWHRLRRLALNPELLERKRHAIHAHDTQLTPRDGGEAAVLTPESLERLLRPDEYFFAPEERA